MYHPHFGLETRLFGDGIATDAGVFRSSKHDQIRAHFKLALSTPSSGVLVRGPAGVGKTTLTSAALRAISTRLAVAWLNATPGNAAELLELVLVELGMATSGTSRIERLQLWRQFQTETRATETRLFVVVERAEDFPPDLLHALDSLTAADAIGNLGANIVLLGHRGIDDHLAAPALESLRQRIRLRAELAPFTEAELQDYLRHQVACAGGHYDHVFAPGTVAALHRYSGGVARLANSLCETALDLAALQKQKLLTAELVSKTAVSLLGLADSRSVPRVAPDAAETPPPVAAVVSAPVPAAASAPAPTPSPPAAVVPRAPVAAAAPLPVPAVPAPVLMAPTPVLVAPAVASIAMPSAAAARGPALSAASTEKPASPARREFEFDGGATDITDVAFTDYPVLTDAVEMPPTAPPAKRPPAAARPQAAAPPAAAAPRATAAVAPAPPVTATKPAAPSSSRIDTAYAAPKAAPAPKPTPPAAPKPAAPAAVPRIAAANSEDDDQLRQTHTMRAIAVAKSIDDISSSMAETLFGDAHLDLVTAALASAAAEWAENEGPPALASTPTPAPAAAAAARKPEPAKVAATALPPDDDPFDFLGLGDDAPLELIDDSAQPPADKSRKSAAR